MSTTWADEDGAVDFVKQLRARYKAQVQNLIGAAGHSSDPNIRSNWAALQQLEQVIKLMEDERGKPED